MSNLFMVFEALKKHQYMINFVEFLKMLLNMAKELCQKPSSSTCTSMRMPCKSKKKITKIFLFDSSNFSICRLCEMN